MRSVTQALATVQAWGRRLGVGVAGLGSQARGWGNYPGTLLRPQTYSDPNHYLRPSYPIALT